MTVSALRPDGIRRSDGALLSLVHRGDLSALGELYDRYHADVWRVLHRVMSGGADVDDLVQATFLALPKIAGSFEGDGPCRGWMCGIAVRLASRQRRSLARWLGALTSFGQASSAVSVRDPESHASEREDLRRFETALGKISPKKRDAFVLVELEGVAVEDAARALGVPVPTIRTRLFHARNELRAAMHQGQR